MLEQSVLMVVKRYLSEVKQAGIEVEFGVVFGSQATGNSHEWSDIDLLVVSPLFENMSDRKNLNLLWRLAGRIDSRIEPIPCGLRQWEEDNVSAIIEVARREGEILMAA